MDYIIKERLNMPEISAASINMTYNRPDLIKKLETTNHTPTIMQTCKTCSKEYNQTQATRLLEKLPTLPDFDYQNTCLTCIKQQSSTSKTSKYPNLSELRKNLDELNIIYQQAFNKWKAASKEYKALDYQENMLVYELNQLQEKAAKLATKKQSAKPSATKKPTNSALVMQILANLSPEQREAVLTNLAKQSAS